MELKAIVLFTEFPYVNLLYRANDGEYFVELDDVQAYLQANGVGSYTIIERTNPLPPLPEPLPEDLPIWVLINNPTVISNGLRYDGVISYTSVSVGFTGNKDMAVNKVGAYRVGNYVLAVSRKGSSVGMSKYGKIVAINQNVLTINFLEHEGTANLTNDEWDIVLTGRRGIQGIQGVSGVTGLIHNSTADPTINTVANVGDLFLNTTTGSLYEKSSMTQSEFFAGGFQGIVLSNAIWLIRGNLKGPAGAGYDSTSTTNLTVGTNGSASVVVNKVGAYIVGSVVRLVSTGGSSAGMWKQGVITAINSNTLTINFDSFGGMSSATSNAWSLSVAGLTGPAGADGATGPAGTNARWYAGTTTPPTDSYNVGDWYLRSSTGDVFEKTGLAIWTNRGNIKGANGQNGQNGQSAILVLPTNLDGGNYDIQPSDFGRIISAVGGVSTMQLMLEGTGSVIINNSQSQSINVISADNSQSINVPAKSISIVSFVGLSTVQLTATYYEVKTMRMTLSGSTSVSTVTLNSQSLKKIQIPDILGQNATWSGFQYIENTLVFEQPLTISALPITINPQRYQEGNSAPDSFLASSIQNNNIYLNRTTGELWLPNSFTSAANCVISYQYK